MIFFAGIADALAPNAAHAALGAAIASCVAVDVASARFARVRSTKHMELLLVSEALLPDVLASGSCEVVEPLHPIAFDADGMFTESLGAS